MSIATKNTGLELGGKPLQLIRLENNRGTSVTLSNYGCLILSWIVRDGRGDPNDIVLGFDRLDDYLDESYLEHYPYFGVLVGRYANRIKDASFRLDDMLVRLPANKGKDHIHGGLRGFDRAVWSTQEIDETGNRVVFSYTSTDGEEGYPGNLELQVAYTLTNENELIQEMTARTDKPTALNLTHHDYFNLNNGRGQINDHLLTIPADSWLEQDDNMVVTGNLVPVDGTGHDFRSGKEVGRDLPQPDGYDQTFVLDKSYGELSLAAILESRQSGLRLEVRTTEPVCHLYTGRWVPGVTGKDGQAYGPFSGLCLEVQHHPNAVNVPGFPSTELRPGETYHQRTIFKVSAG